MKKFIWMLTLALAALAMANSAHATATWKHFNADPAYQSREAAIADAPRVLKQAGYPEPVIALLTEAMESSGIRTHITNGMKLDFMRSGKSDLWRNVVVDFEKPPNEKSMELSAPSEEWTVDWKGTLYAVLLPDVCNNLAALPPLAKLKQVDVPFRPISGSCPNGYLLVANAWSLSAMPQRLRDTAMKLVNEAEERDSENASKRDAYKPSAFSRTLGGPLRHEVKTRADVSTRITVNLRDPLSFKVVQTLGAMEMVNGIGKMSLTKDQVAMIVETIWPNGFLSPAISGGERRIELFPNEWGKWCEMNVSGAKP